MMGNFTTRFFKSLCALFSREESGKPIYLQGQQNIANILNEEQNSGKCIKTQKTSNGERLFLHYRHGQPCCKRECSQPLQNDGTLQ